MPDPAVIDALQLEMNAIGFMTGTSAALDDVAYGMAWEAAEAYLGTNLLMTGTDCERHMFPKGWLDFDANFRYLQLNKANLVSVVSATVVHDMASCDCYTDDVTACTLAYDLRQSIVEIRAGAGAIAAGCGCLACGLPAWVDICYIAGLWASLADMPDGVKVAVAILAQEFQALVGGGGANINASFVTQWSSMDYSETLALVGTVLGSSAQASMADRLLRPFKVKRMVGFRGRPAFD